jgi:hypothetical protein
VVPVEGEASLSRLEAQLTSKEKPEKMGIYFKSENVRMT